MPKCVYEARYECAQKPFNSCSDKYVSMSLVFVSKM